MIRCTSQIRWLSDLTLFYFDIKYRVGKSNQAADALSRRPANPDSASESSDGEDEWEAISYDMVCQILDYHLDSSQNSLSNQTRSSSKHCRRY